MRLLLRMFRSHEYVNTPDVALVELDEEFLKGLDRKIARAIELQQEDAVPTDVEVSYLATIACYQSNDIVEACAKQAAEFDIDELYDHGYTLLKDSVELPEPVDYSGGLCISLGSMCAGTDDASIYWECRDKYAFEIILTSPYIPYGELRKLVQEKNPAS